MEQVEYELLDLIKYTPSKELTEIGLASYNNWIGGAFQETTVKHGRANFTPRFYDLDVPGNYHLIKASDGLLFWLFRQEVGPIPIETVREVHKILIGYQIIQAATSTTREQKPIGFTNIPGEDEEEVVAGKVYGEEKLAANMQSIKESIDRVGDILREVLTVLDNRKV